jgi:hypothetical protein
MRCVSKAFGGVVFQNEPCATNDRIVRTAYRYKRPSGRRKPVALEVPAVTGVRRGTLPLRVLSARMRHEGCGGGAGRVELMTGIDGVSSRPVRRIVLRVG